MQRQYTKADRKRDEAAAQEKYAKKHPGIGIQPVKTFKVGAGAANYDREQEYYREMEEARERKYAEEEERKADLARKLEAAQSTSGTITSAKLYEEGLASRSSSSGLEAATLLWQALVCGEGRAAYPLFEILRDGENGVGKNMEMAGVILAIGKRMRDSDCRSITDVTNPDSRAAGQVYIVCADAAEEFRGKFITREIVSIQQSKVNAVLDEKSTKIKTRDWEEPMVAVFAHTDTENEKLLDVGLSGEPDHHESGSKCILM